MQATRRCTATLLQTPACNLWTQVLRAVAVQIARTDLVCCCTAQSATRIFLAVGNALQGHFPTRLACYPCR